ncbi:MAG: AAA family ATPase [Balneola sp.]|nr:AAA family ATPase [Balneola sp.]
MIVGVFLRHYKIFKNINYIPLSDGESFSAIIGDNGVGKSTVLEALDLFFNPSLGREWSVNLQARKEGGIKDPYIVPVYLIPKKDAFSGSIRRPRPKKDEDQVEKGDLLKELSKLFWKVDYQSNVEALEKFYEHRKILKTHKYEDAHYLFVGGRSEKDTKGIHFGPFQAKPVILPALKEIFDREKITKVEDFTQNFDPLYQDLLNYYKYIYLPVDLDILNYSKLESSSMQRLMDRKIHDDIRGLFKRDLRNEINDSLQGYIDEIQESMNGYSYDKTGRKGRLTSKDLADKAIEEFFSIKVLHKDIDKKYSIPINELSSGEKKKALVDLAYHFLKTNKKNNNVIIAIDEPESSINVSSSYEQFEKVKALSEYNQVLITTHWYGFLPVLMDGHLVFLSVSKDNTVESFSMKLGNIPEEIKHLKRMLKGPLPSSIQIKSTTDLVQSIISSLQADEPYNWLICEGTSEKIYFEYFLKDLVEEKNLRVLPVGGRDNVNKFYQYLLTPISDSEVDIGGKIVCLIDTDKDLIDVSIPDNKRAKKRIKFLRLLNQSGEISLVQADSKIVNPPTEIEHALHPFTFKSTLKEVADKKMSGVLKEIEENKKATISAEAYDMYDRQKKELKAFFNRKNGENKLIFAEAYVDKDRDYKTDRIPEWVSMLKEEF